MRFIASGKSAKILRKVCGNFAEIVRRIPATTPSRTTPEVNGDPPELSKINHRRTFSCMTLPPRWAKTFGSSCPLHQMCPPSFWVRRVQGGVGVVHVKGWGSKSSLHPSKVCFHWFATRATIYRSFRTQEVHLCALFA